MNNRFKILGVVMALIGLVFMVAGGVAYFMTQQGYDSLQSFSEAQNVTLNYNEDGQLIDRGTVEGAEAIMSLLEDDWGYTVVGGELDPADPLVNTGSEYMFQMATIAYHVLHGTQTVVLTEDAERADGTVLPAGEYEVAVNEVGSPERVAAGLGGYWTDFNRTDPLEGPARAQAWSGTAHGLVGELGVGTVTHSALKLALAMSGLFAGLGATFVLLGGGIFWASRAKEEDVTKLAWTDEPVRDAATK